MGDYSMSLVVGVAIAAGAVALALLPEVRSAWRRWRRRR